MNEIAINKKEAPLVERDFVIHSSKLRREVWLDALAGISVAVIAEILIIEIGVVAMLALGWM
jgi:hypothetical protein